APSTIAIRMRHVIRGSNWLGVTAMKRLFILAALILACPALAPAQETPSDWIRKLGSRNYADREKAARALEQLGKPGLALLREAMNHIDLETKRRAILIMERIEDRVMLDDVLTATPVHLRIPA